MYLEYFGLDKLPFTISPDPDFLYPSPGHQEALAHLSYALTDQGGLICLTGEVGTGKTTLCRALMESVPEGDHVAYIFNPQLSPIELMQSICDDLGVEYQRDATLKEVYAAINQALVEFYGKHQRVICVIDEAQSMPAALLEQVRLLTNLETHREKLLTLVLVGQPELRELLKRHDLRQLNQRITARYHLNFLNQSETAEYIEHRLVCAGSELMLFDPSAVATIWRASEGTPRLINSICDRALLGAYATGKRAVDQTIARQAIIEVLGSDADDQAAAQAEDGKTKSSWVLRWLLMLTVFALVALVGRFGYPLLSGFPSVGLDRADPIAVINAQTQEGEARVSCQAVDVRCVTVDWDLQALVRVQQPVALKVVGGDWYSLDEYQSGYTGEAMIFWTPPTGYSSAVKPGESAPVIRWIRTQLDANWNQDWTSIGPSGVQVTMDPEFYDPLLERAVAEFQIEVGLKADRIIGPKTIMYLQARD